MPLLALKLGKRWKTRKILRGTPSNGGWPEIILSKWKKSRKTELRNTTCVYEYKRVKNEKFKNNSRFHNLNGRKITILWRWEKYGNRNGCGVYNCSPCTWTLLSYEWRKKKKNGNTVIVRIQWNTENVYKRTVQMSSSHGSYRNTDWRDYHHEMCDCDWAFFVAVVILSKLGVFVKKEFVTSKHDEKSRANDSAYCTVMLHYCYEAKNSREHVPKPHTNIVDFSDAYYHTFLYLRHDSIATCIIRQFTISIRKKILSERRMPSRICNNFHNIV